MAASYTRVPTSSAHPVGGRSSARISCAEHVMTVGSRIYFSSFYRVIYFIMVLSSLLCIVWTGLNKWHIPSSLVFISLEITVSALLVFEVLLRMMAYKRRFWSKWSNLFDVMALVLSLVSVAVYFNEDGVIGELEEVTSDTILALRNGIQYIRLAIFLKNRTEKVNATGADITFEFLPDHPLDDDERDIILDAENGLHDDSDSELELTVVATSPNSSSLTTIQL